MPWRIFPFLVIVENLQSVFYCAPYNMSSGKSKCDCAAFRLSQDSLLCIVAPVLGQDVTRFQSSSSLSHKQNSLVKTSTPEGNPL
jgi:hypothetical protein